MQNSSGNEGGQDGKASRQDYRRKRTAQYNDTEQERYLQKVRKLNAIEATSSSSVNNSLTLDSIVLHSSSSDTNTFIYESVDEVEEHNVDTYYDSDSGLYNNRSHVSYDESNSERTNESSSESEDGNPEENKEGIDALGVADMLRMWKQSNTCVTQSALTQLLKGLGEVIPGLPSDARTLMHTPRQVNVENKCGGEFVYFGLKEQLEKFLSAVSECSDFKNLKISVLSLRFNIDGLPIFKSSSLQLWSFLVSIKEFPHCPPFPIALFLGHSKPTVTDFLNQFVVEINALQENGMSLRNDVIAIKIDLFICDAPARSLIKCICGHNGKESCEKCTAKGITVKDARHNLHAPLRTHEGFVQQVDIGHHNCDAGESPLLQCYNFDIIKQVVYDPLHLCYLGVNKRLVSLYKQGSYYARKSFSDAHANIINEYIKHLSSYWPSDFNRKPRSLSELSRWKGTELRNFVYFIAPIVFKATLTKKKYDHFLHYFCGITILCREDLCYTKNEKASEYLHAFVAQSDEILGRAFASYNVHGLIHISEEVKCNGSLDSYSAWIYENFMQQYKAMVKKGTQTLQQICKRLIESKYVVKVQCDNEKPHVVERSKVNNTYNTAIFKGHRLSNDRRDSCVMLKNGHVVQIKYFEQKEGDITMSVVQLLQPEALFSLPCSSLELSIFVFRNRTGPLKRDVHLSNIKCKGALLPYKDRHVFIPLSRHY